MRNRLFLLLDVILLAGLPAFATTLRFESLSIPPDVARALLAYSLLVLPIRIALAYAFGLYRCLWRHASLNELQRIVFAACASAAVSAVLGTIGLQAMGLATTRLPLSALLLDAILTLGAFTTPRLLDQFAGRRRRTDNDRRAIIVGAGAAGQLILRETRLNDRLRVTIVAFVDDDESKQT